MYCPKCGKKISDHENFCKECGYKISNSENNYKKKHGKKKIIIPVVLAGVIALGSGGYFFISNNGEKQDKQDKQDKSVEISDKPSDKNTETVKNDKANVKTTINDENKQTDKSEESSDTQMNEQETTDSTIENILTDPVTMGWGGAYKDEDTGERIIIAAIGYEWSYCFYKESGEVFQEESHCSSSVDGYLVGEYYSFGKNENGLLGVTSGAGGVWGNFRRISGTNNTDTEIEGQYGDEDTIITVSEQMVAVGDENVPGGSDIAAVNIQYNNGLVINARLYTQGDQSLAIVDSNTKSLYGIITFKNQKAVVQGSNFDGEYELVKNK